MKVELLKDLDAKAIDQVSNKDLYTSFFNILIFDESLSLLNHHHRVLIYMQVQEHLPHQLAPSGNWLAAHRADGNFGKTAICIFGAKFYDWIPFLSPSPTLSAVQELHLFPTDLCCVLHSLHHELVVLFRLTTATAL